MLYIFCFIFHAEIISSFFLMSAERINPVGYSRRVKIPTNLTTTVPEVSHNYAFLLQHSRFCRLTCSPIGKDDNPEPRRWALQASLMWKREDSLISSWTSDSSCENAYQILLMMLADLQHPSTVQSQSWDLGLGKCKSQGSHQSYARWEQEQAAEPHLQRLLTQVITKFRQHILTKVWEGITIV